MVTHTTMPIMVTVSYSQIHHNPFAHMSIVCVCVYVRVCVRDECVYCVGICGGVCARVSVRVSVRVCVCECMCIREGEKYTG